MVGATVVLSITMTGTVGVIHVITQAGGDAAVQTQQRTVTALAMNRMRREIRHAITVAGLTANGIEFTHPDITGDDADDTIAYAWSGTTGDPLTRSLNGGTAQVLVSHCNDLTFQIEVGGQVDSVSAPTETAEVLIASHDTYPDGYANTINESAVTSSKYVAQTFTPTYDGAASFRITRVKMSLKKTDWWVWGTLTVGIHGAQDGTVDPSSSPIDEVDYSISNLSTGYLWEEFNFSDAIDLPVGAPFCLVVHTNKSSTYVRWESHELTSGTYDDGVIHSRSGDAGATWDTFGEYTVDARFFVYGVFDVPSGEITTVESGVLSLIHIHLESVEGDNVLVLDGATECLNQPDLTGFASDALPIL